MLDVKNKMTESATGKIEMVNVTEKGARAFLAFLYYRDSIVAVRDSSSVALELLELSEKYEIQDLKRSIIKLFVETDDLEKTTWWTCEVAVKLYLFANRMDPETGDDLKKKSIRTLKT